MSSLYPQRRDPGERFGVIVRVLQYSIAPLTEGMIITNTLSPDCKQMESFVVPVLTPGDLNPEFMDLSQISSVYKIYKAIAEGGWVLLKGCASLSPETTEADIKSHQVIKAICRYIQGEYAYEVGTFFGRTRRTTKNDRWIRVENWRDMAQGDGTSVLFCNFLGGKEQDKWTVQYDTAGRKEGPGSTGVINASGKDIFVMASYFKFRPPCPEADGLELDMAIIHLNWKKKQEAVKPSDNQ